MKTNLQIINSSQGKPEYVLLPLSIYSALKDEIDEKLRRIDDSSDYVDFRPEEFIKNPIALARFKAKITQTALAKELETSQAYISKIENDDYQVSEKLFKKTTDAVKRLTKNSSKK